MLPPAPFIKAFVPSSPETIKVGGPICLKIAFFRLNMEFRHEIKAPVKPITVLLASAGPFTVWVPGQPAHCLFSLGLRYRMTSTGENVLKHLPVLG